MGTLIHFSEAVKRSASHFIEVATQLPPDADIRFVEDAIGRVTSLACSAIAHCEEDALAKWAAGHELPVTTVESAGNDSDLLPLESAIVAAHVIALGEPMHGAHEPLAFRIRLLRFLGRADGIHPEGDAAKTWFPNARLRARRTSSTPAKVMAAVERLQTQH